MAKKIEYLPPPPVEGVSSLAFIEIANLAPTLIVADRICKAAGVRILGIESPDSASQCIKIIGTTAEVREAADVGAAWAKKMGASCTVTVLAGALPETYAAATTPPQYSPLLDTFDTRAPRRVHMTGSDAIGLLETQGLVAALHATDTMLKSANVRLVGKEKIGAAYITIMIRGDVAAVQSAIESGKKVVEQLGGKLILADVIARPHPDLAALLPA